MQPTHPRHVGAAAGRACAVAAQLGRAGGTRWRQRQQRQRPVWQRGAALPPAEGAAGVLLAACARRRERAHAWPECGSDAATACCRLLLPRMQAVRRAQAAVARRSSLASSMLFSVEGGMLTLASSLAGSLSSTQVVASQAASQAAAASQALPLPSQGATSSCCCCRHVLCMHACCSRPVWTR